MMTSGLQDNVQCRSVTAQTDASVATVCLIEALLMRDAALESEKQAKLLLASTQQKLAEQQRRVQELNHRTIEQIGMRYSEHEALQAEISGLMEENHFLRQELEAARRRSSSNSVVRISVQSANDRDCSNINTRRRSLTDPSIASVISVASELTDSDVDVDASDSTSGCSNDELRDSSDLVVAATRAHGLSEEIRDVRRDVEGKYQTFLAQHDILRERLESSGTVIRLLQREKLEVSENLERALNSLTSANATILADAAACNKRHSVLTGMNEQLDNQLKAANEHIAELTYQRELTQEVLIDAQRQREVALLHVNELQCRIDQLESSFQTQSTQMETLCNKVAAQALELGLLLQQNHGLRVDVADLTELLHQSDETLQQLRLELNQTQVAWRISQRAASNEDRRTHQSSRSPQFPHDRTASHVEFDDPELASSQSLSSEAILHASAVVARSAPTANGIMTIVNPLRERLKTKRTGRRVYELSPTSIAPVSGNLALPSASLPRIPLMLRSSQRKILPSPPQKSEISPVPPPRVFSPPR
eukprot:TRINITY_DN492_c0_g1_i3.p2 TRINITY_DN492_c0_g1~~TRINITY_DN492_c0_g1_i3.p2  ORF type:complete len:537 (+),score=85.73 TRINITY_DN492_c0_g1_i3:552-2162(+)